MSYLLDANVFMAANNPHYGLDFCPALVTDFFGSVLKKILC